MMGSKAYLPFVKFIKSNLIKKSDFFAVKNNILRSK